MTYYEVIRMNPDGTLVSDLWGNPIVKMDTNVLEIAERYARSCARRKPGQTFAVTRSDDRRPLAVIRTDAQGKVWTDLEWTGAPLL